jgi:hypothetical protein
MPGTRPSRFNGPVSNGFLCFDALFSLMPVLMMALFIMGVSAAVAGNAAGAMHGQEVFDKVVSAADYTVKTGYARVGPDGLKRPNWMRDEGIDEAYVEGLRLRAGLAVLEISYTEPDSAHDVCIYRLVAVGDDMEIARLFACGDG